MSAIERHGVTARYADAVIHAGIIHLVEVPASSAGPIETQTREALESIGRQLARLGSDPARILMATIYLVDMADYAGMNAVWDAWVPAGHAPPRATVEARLAHPDWKIEVVVTAAQR